MNLWIALPALTWGWVALAFVCMGRDAWGFMPILIVVTLVGGPLCWESDDEVERCRRENIVARDRAIRKLEAEMGLPITGGCYLHPDQVADAAMKLLPAAPEGRAGAAKAVVREAFYGDLA